MRTPVGEKVLTLARQSSALRPYFGTTKFRWAPDPLPQGYIPTKPGDAAPGGGTSSVRYKTVSAVSDYMQTGPSSLERVRVQFDILDLSKPTCERAAFAVEDFMGTVNLVTGEQFGSPVSTPSNFPSFLTNRRDGVEAQAGALCYVVSVDVIFINNTAN